MKSKLQNESIDNVIWRNKCISCGACHARCPVGAIELRYSELEGKYIPRVSHDKCINCGICMKGCPVENKYPTNRLIGEYFGLFLAHAKNKEVRMNATSGGVVSSLVQYLLEQDVVEGVLMAGYDQNSEIETSAMLITKEQVSQIKSATRDYASRYVLCPVLTNIKGILEMHERIAVVGTPCQIRALNLLEENIKNKYIFKIGITCSGGMSYNATEQYKKYEKMPTAKMYYRGDGWPGKNALIENDVVVEHSHLGSLYERMFSSQIFKNFGCIYCTDHFAETADISFCDFWNSKELEDECIGNSCVIVRSEQAKGIFEELIIKGYIDVVRELEKEEILETQMFVLKAKKGNLRNSILYKFFLQVTRVIFKHKFYVYFGIREYKFFAAIYGKLCSMEKIDFYE